MVVFFSYFLMLLWITNDRFSCSLTIDNASESELRTSLRVSIHHSSQLCKLLFVLRWTVVRSHVKRCVMSPRLTHSECLDSVRTVEKPKNQLFNCWLRCDDSTHFFPSSFFLSSTRYKNRALCNVFAAAVSLYKFHERKLFLKIFNFFFPPHVFLVELLLPLLSMPTHNNLFFGVARLIGAGAIKQYTEWVCRVSWKECDLAANGGTRWWSRMAVEIHTGERERYRLNEQQQNEKRRSESALRNCTHIANGVCGLDTWINRLAQNLTCCIYIVAYRLWPPTSNTTNERRATARLSDNLWNVVLQLIQLKIVTLLQFFFRIGRRNERVYFQWVSDTY